MHRFLMLLCFCLPLLLMVACGASQPAETQTEPVPTTTSAPVETTSPYPEADKLIALTFDDGPNVHLETMLDIAAEYDAKFTFFLIGKKISASTEAMIKRAYDEGHEIGNHSYSHEDMTTKTEPEILSEISQTQNAVKAITGEEPAWYRPPFLRANDLTFSLIEMPNAHCSVSAGDGSNDNLAEDRHYRVTSGAHDGAIVLLHCTDITAEVLPRILHDLKMQGYEFVTISELFQRNGVTPDPNAHFQYKDITTNQ